MRVVGNQVVPVRILIVSGLIVAVTDYGIPARIVLTGLYPRNASNNAPVGGISLIGTMRFEAPTSFSDRASSSGNSLVRLIITIVKNIAMEVTIPLFATLPSFQMQHLARQMARSS